MKQKKRMILCVLTAICLTVVTGCGHTEPSISADLSYMKTDMGKISVSPDVQVVGLGEASHGVAQYQQMKEDVFKALVENNGCHTFIIEGDFGGALKVDQYINGGNGTAEEAVSEIGFGIYRTKEMVDLVKWMRSYNEAISPEKALHFYGMDFQRFDNNKEYLFSVISKTHPQLSEKYSEALSALNDKNRNSLDQSTLKSAQKTISELINQMDTIKPDIVNTLGETTFDFAKECAISIESYCRLQLSDNYNATRDQLMYEKVEWFLQHGDHTVLFINGHNGHIARKSVAGYTCLGELLSNHLGKKYYSIGTDALLTKFNSQKDDGTFKVMKVRNSNDFNSQFTDEDSTPHFIDFASADSNKAWKQILNSKQPITMLNVGLSRIQTMLKATYAAKVIPADTFDGMIIFYKVTPSTLLND